MTLSSAHSYATDDHKHHAVKHDHKGSDWLHANSTQVYILIPITQFVTVVVSEHYILPRRFYTPSTNFRVVQMLILLQVIFSFYLFYIPFYSSKSKMWNSCGIYMHAVAMLFAFCLLPITICVFGFIDVTDMGIETQHSAIHVIIFVCQLANMIGGTYMFCTLGRLSW